MDSKVYPEPIRRATVFEFTSYEWEPTKKRVVFHYKTEFEGREAISWTEAIILPEVPKHEVPQKLLESLHIILGISYWKFYCPPSIALAKEGATLSKGEADFWNTVYKKGLGEFFYKNKLDPKISPKFQATNSKPQTILDSSFQILASGRSLVGIGGGKDSIVSAELLKEAGFDFTSFNIELNRPSELVDNVMNLIGAPQLKIRRVLDEKVYQKHPYNGHIPISAIYAFLGVFACALYGYKYFIVSNEHSSNFGNITYLPAGRQGKGLEVNHQWSKSFEFETLFSNYVKNFISPDVTYFSLMRPFYEIRIVKMFAKFGKKYFKHFSSCNRNFTTKNAGHGGLWCNQCAKCVFAFTLLSAFLPKKELLNIFGKNLYQDKALLPLFKDILGLGTMKPFDCVGTFEEAQTALILAKKNFKQDFIIRQLSPVVRTTGLVFQTARANALPEAFKFLGLETVQIVREEGIEGQATKKFLKKFYPKLKIVKSGGDMTIKTPGINKSQITGYYTTPTNIFFSSIRRRASDNLIIGVTGSKGKSTTTSLIYHILKTVGKNVEIMGNIGVPMLDAITKSQTTNHKIFVLELSSFQLDDIKFSPDIAVVTNLFPEHMDFHGSLKNYYTAKKNIFKFQSLPAGRQEKNDHLVFCVKAKQKYETSLLGRHNQNNIEAAAQVARILKIPETTITKAIKTFEGLPHRLENVGTFKGITFYDDAISTTPDSTIMAIKALKNIDTIFLGGQDRGYDFGELEKVIMRHKIKNIVLFPDSGEKILTTLQHPSTKLRASGSGQNLRILKTKKMEEAVKFAYKNTKEGSVCLLSCASPSYSLWKNFEEKGEQFKKFVKKFSK